MGSLLTVGTLKVARWPIFLEAALEGHCGALMRGRGHDLSWVRLWSPPLEAAMATEEDGRTGMEGTRWQVSDWEVEKQW